MFVRPSGLAKVRNWVATLVSLSNMRFAYSKLDSRSACLAIRPKREGSDGSKSRTKAALLSASSTSIPPSLLSWKFTSAWSAPQTPMFGLARGRSAKASAEFDPMNSVAACFHSIFWVKRSMGDFCGRSERAANLLADEDPPYFEAFWSISLLREEKNSAS